MPPSIVHRQPRAIPARRCLPAARLALVLLVVTGTGSASEATPFSGRTAPPPAIAAREATSVALDLATMPWSGLGAAAGAPCWRTATVDGLAVLDLDLTRCADPAARIWCAIPRDIGDAAWRVQGCDCIAFEARADGPATLALYAIAGRAAADDAGKSCPFTVDGDAWRTVVIPVAWLDVQRVSTLHGLGFHRPAAPVGSPTATSLQVRNLRLARSAYAESDIRHAESRISLLGGWRFAPEQAGVDGGAVDCDDRNWAVVQAGKSLQDQGLTCPGWSWYRQSVVIPASAARATVSIALAKFMFDDEVYVNGTRIGATRGLYRFAEFDEREYVIPAELIRYDEPTRIAIRLWGSDGLRWNRTESGLVLGPYAVRIRSAALLAKTASDAAAVPVECFDMSGAQRGMPFELVARLPDGVAVAADAHAHCDLVDAAGRMVHSGAAQVREDATGVSLVAAVPEASARELYLRGRFTARFTVVDNRGGVIAAVAFPLDRPCYAERDGRILPALPETVHETPYGRLRLVDEIDAAEPVERIPHPYMQNPFAAGKGATPGGPLRVAVRDILGRPARVAEEPGWFAYRIGRGGLHAGRTYLLRIEYPEDVPRYAAVQIQAGRNQVGVGWRNGVAPGDPYDDYPLSGAWQWFDTIVVAGEATVGYQGAYSAPGTAGMWVYLINKVNPGKYFPMYAGGPAVGRIRLYEIDAERDAPRIARPVGLPARTLLVDWEREPDQDVAGVCAYARLMGYSAVAPTILKWGTALWAPPLAGYAAAGTDARDQAIERRSDDVHAAPPAIDPARLTAHEQYLRETAANHLAYLPRIEYGGSAALPEAAWAVDAQGGFAKPNRYAQWSANLLHEDTWTDFKRLLDHLIKPHADSTIAGILWRIRSERMQISYGGDDLRLFASETGREFPLMERKAFVARVASGDLAEAYRAWWFAKRAQFHIRLRDLLRSYRADMTLGYYNWDIDKWGLGIYDQTTARYFADVAQAGEGNAVQVYRRNLGLIAGYTGDDFVRMVRTGTINPYLSGRADQAMEMDPYRTFDGIHVFCPSNYVYSSDSPAYLGYFRTASGVAVSNTVSYDENGYKRLHPNFECNMVIGGGGNFSMANEVLAWFHADARVLTFTTYTFARGFADAHRRFTQAFLALPAVPGTVLPGADPQVCIRSYADGAYIGLANRGPTAKAVTVRLPGRWSSPLVVTDLVGGATVPSRSEAGDLVFTVQAGAMELDAFSIR